MTYFSKDKKDRIPCSATAKWSNQPCRAQAVPGSDPPLCEKHGGKLDLMNVPLDTKVSFEAKRWRKHLPTNLQERYEQSLNDPDILSSRNEIALIDVRLADVIESLQESSQSSSRLWNDLNGEVQKFKKLVRKFKGIPPQEIVMNFLGLITEAIEVGSTSSELWGEIRSLVNDRKKLAESERRRLVEMHQMVTTEEALSMQRAIIEIIRNHVKEPTVLRAIAEDVKKLDTIGVG